MAVPFTAAILQCNEAQGLHAARGGDGRSGRDPQCGQRAGMGSRCVLSSTPSYGLRFSLSSFHPSSLLPSTRRLTHLRAGPHRHRFSRGSRRCTPSASTGCACFASWANPTSPRPRRASTRCSATRSPFDRHDWVISRCGKEVTYLLDFYNGRGDAGQACCDAH